MMFLIILLAIVCVILGAFVLIQNPKGGGLATGNSGNNMFGVQRTGDVLEKGSWILISLIVVLSLAITTMAKSGGAAGSDFKFKEQLDKTPTSTIGSGLQQKPAATTKDTTKK